MANTYVKIASVTVGVGGAANIEFTNIPATYDDLAIILSTRTNRAAPDIIDAININFNNVSTNLSWRGLAGDGVNASSSNAATEGRVALTTGLGATTSTFGSASIYIPNYRSATNKSWSSDSVTENNATNAWQQLVAGLWSNTSAITSIKLFPLVGTLINQHSTAVLYGIKRT